MNPFKGNRLNPLTEQQTIYNKRISHARKTIEDCFGIITNRFRIFKTSISVNVEVAKQITAACCCLHNFLVSHNRLNYLGREYDINDDWRNIPFQHNRLENFNLNQRPNVIANELRSFLATFFSSPEGTVAWQNEED